MSQPVWRVDILFVPSRYWYPMIVHNYKFYSMKHFIKSLVLLVAMTLFTGVGLHAQEPVSVDGAMHKLVKKYEDTKGVDCIVLTKGLRLSLVKLAMEDQLGEDSMKGVRSMTIIDYGSASAKVCQALRKDLEAVTSLLEELEMSEDEKSQKGTKRCFVGAVNPKNGKVSNLLVVIEDDSDKMVVYMAGSLVVK